MDSAQQVVYRLNPVQSQQSALSLELLSGIAIAPHARIAWHLGDPFVDKRPHHLGSTVHAILNLATVQSRMRGAVLTWLLVCKGDSLGNYAKWLSIDGTS